MTNKTPNTPLAPDQRRRLRRIVRAGLVSMISIEMIVAALVFAAPRVRATGIPVIDGALIATTGFVLGALGMTNATLESINGTLSRIDSDTQEIRRIADEQSEPLNSSWSANLAAVTSTPMEEMRGISFADDAPGAALAGVIPGTEPWTNYHEEYLASADTVLSTLRSSLDVLHVHNREIENEEALRRIAGLADEKMSRLALGALKVQSNLEIARQLHALRSQHALETSLYAITESHRIGTEARSKAEDNESNCRRMAALLGPVGDGAGVFIC